MELVRKPATSTGNGGEIDSAIATKITLWDQASKLAATDQTRGLYAPGLAPGQTSGVIIAPGYIGERISASLTNTTLTTTNVVFNTGTISLSAGVWIVYGKVSFGTAGTTQTQCIAGVGLTSATLDNAQIGIDNSSGITASRHVHAAPMYLNLSTTTTVYLYGRSEFTGTAPVVAGASSLFYAVRIA